MQKQSLWFGILCGIGTGAFWGIPFVAPQILANYSAIYLTLGRFGFFGLVSLIFLPKVIGYLRGLSAPDLLQVFLLSLSGFSVYSFLLFWSVPKAGGLASALIIGLLPITISMFGFKERAITKSFYVGIGFILCGLLLLTLPTLQMSQSPADQKTTILGYLGCIVCLALWTWFANQNSKFLRKHPNTDPRVFSAVMGILSMGVVLPMFFLTTSEPLTYLSEQSDLMTYIYWSLALGLGASWAANWLWNICSKNCPPQISGPLIVSETFFGLLYTFIYQARLPTLTETLSIVLSITGVLICIRSQMRS